LGLFARRTRHSGGLLCFLGGNFLTGRAGYPPMLVQSEVVAVIGELETYPAFEAKTSQRYWRPVWSFLRQVIASNPVRQTARAGRLRGSGTGGITGPGTTGSIVPSGTSESPTIWPLSLIPSAATERSETAFAINEARTVSRPDAGADESCDLPLVVDPAGIS
jgi:hypothetical protein